MRLRDVAQTVDDAENTRLAAWAGTPERARKSGVILNIQRQPGANVIDTVDRIKACCPQLQATLPASLDVQVLTDRTTTIRASVATCRSSCCWPLAGGGGDLCVFAQRLGHAHSQLCGAAVAGGHLWRDVPGWAFPSTTSR
jgi:hypothetical protein